MDTQIHFHGSFNRIDAINDEGVFGGIFGTVSINAALSHGEILHEIKSPKPLDDYTLNYEIQGAWEAAIAVCSGNEAQAEAIMSAGCEARESTDAEEGWELQRLRGKLAARLGFTSVEMLDEHGTTWLCLPGCEILVLQA